MRKLCIPYKLIALLALTCIRVAHAAEGPIDFDTAGGDAWTFEKYVSGRVNATVCDEVRVESPAGSVVALISGERFAAHVPLQSGSNEVRALCKQKGAEVARSNPQHWLTRISDKPRAWIRVRVDDKKVLMDTGRSQSAPGAAAPISTYEWRARAGNPAPLMLTPESGSLDAAPSFEKSIQIGTPAADGEYYVTLRVTDSLGRSDESTALFQVIDGNPKEVDLDSHHPAWIDTAVLYGVAPFAFGKGGYEDVRKRLPAIAALGVSVIWLSPITEAAPDDFGYAVTDHFQTRDEFGSEQQLRALIDAAHGLGMRVIMDFVPNHFASAHRYYADAERNRQRSPYFEWFERDAEGEAQHYFDWNHLKNLEYDQPEVQAYMLEAFSHWVRELGIDGFRVDVSWGVRDRAPEFWPRWREELKRIDPDLLLIAEASAQDGFYFTNGFDAAYDWTSKLGEWAWHDVFAGKRSRPDLERLREALTSSTVGLPAPGTVLRFLNNNDTGARFITRHGVGQTRVAATLLFTLPGLPLIYNGDEVGAQFEPYDEKPISWRDRHGLTPHYTRLSKLRREVAALSSSELEMIKTSHDDAVVAYVRKAAAKLPHGATGCPERDVLVLLNFADETVDLRIPGRTLDTLLENGRLQDRLSGEQLSITSATPIHLKPFDARVLQAPCLGASVSTQR